MYRGICLDPKQRGNVHRGRHTDPRQVVAHQVDDHQILGTLFFSLLTKAVSKRVILLGRAPPRSSSLDRLGFRDPIRGYPQEPLGRGADHRDRVELQKRRVRCGIERPHTAECADRVNGAVDDQGVGQAHLVGFTGPDEVEALAD